MNFSIQEEMKTAWESKRKANTPRSTQAEKNTQGVMVADKAGPA